MEIFQLGAAELAARIAGGELSSREAVTAVMRRIEAVDGRLNAVVFRRFDEAQREAAEADAAQARGDLRGPLHGVPVTVKECFFLAGTPSSVGLTHRAQAVNDDGLPVQRLRRAGAIIVGKTNLPQMMLFHESDNPVYGRTNNPWNLDRTPGGSTGGEAAIIAAGGSPLGLGSDLGGSIRIPCHFTGICGIKPTSGRLPRDGTFRTLRGMESIAFQPGPLARRVEDLALGLRVLADDADGFSGADVCPQPLPILLPSGSAGVDWRKIRIGVWNDDDFFPASPAVRRAVDEAARALAQRGAVAEEFHPPEVEHAMQLYFSIISADGGADVRRLSRGSRLDPRLRRLLWLGWIPRWLRPSIAGPLRFAGQPWMARLLMHTGAVSADCFWQWTAAAIAYTRRFLVAMEERKVDVLLCPPHALPAPPHGLSADLLPAASYSFLPNLLGIPAGVLPVTRVRPDEESDRSSRRDRTIRAAIATERGSAGLPIGVQVAARHWREDLVLAVMAALQESVPWQVAGSPLSP